MRASPLAACAAVLLAAGLTGCSVLAPRGAATPPRPLARDLAYPDLRPAPPPDVRRVELPNGLTILLAADRTLPVIRATARVGVGTVHDPADHVGLAAIAAPTMRAGGAGALAPDALDRALDDVGASVEAFAGEDAVTVSMRTLSDHADAVLPLFAAVLRAPRFDAGRLAIARTAARDAVSRRNDSPDEIAQRALFQTLYGADSPYGRTTEYWTVDAVDAGDAAAWHARHVVPANTRIAVWGDFDPDDMARRLTEAFGDWTTPAGWAAAPTPERTPAADAPGLVFVEKDDVNQSTILVGHAGTVRRDHPDYAALVVMNEILGGGFSSRLVQTVRTDLGLAYSVFGVYTAGYDAPGVFYGGAGTQSARTIEATEAIARIIREMQSAPPTERELDLAKQSYLNAVVFQSDTRAKVLGRMLTLDAYGYPADFVDGLNARIAAVTADDVLRVARQYLTPDRTTTVVVGRSADFGASLTRLGTPDTLDVTIPLVPPDGTPIAGDPVGGRAALEALAEALGGTAAFDAVATLRMRGETRAEVEGQPTTIATETSLWLSEDGVPDGLRLTQRLPTGAEVTVVMDGDATRILTPLGAQAAPPAVVEQVRAQMLLHVAVVVARRAALAPERMPSAEGTVVRLRAPDIDAPFTLTLGADGRPVSIASVQLTPAGPAEVVVRLEDWRETGGLTLPFRYVQTVGGAVQGTTQWSEIDVNPTLDEALFRAN